MSNEPALTATSNHFGNLKQQRLFLIQSVGIHSTFLILLPYCHTLASNRR
jgi:hypothetical protein